MVPVSSPDVYQNTYTQGRIRQNRLSTVKQAAGAACRLLGNCPQAPAASATRYFVAGEKMWVTAIKVTDQNVVFELLTDPYPALRYKASLTIPYADQPDQLVGEVFAVESAQPEPTAAGPSQPPTEPQPNQPQGGSETQFEAIVPPPPPPPDPVGPPPTPPRPTPARDGDQPTGPAPSDPDDYPPLLHHTAPAREGDPATIPTPPDTGDQPPVPSRPTLKRGDDQATVATLPSIPSNGASKQVAVGDTVDRVLAVLGQPSVIGKLLSNKEIYFYPALKVTFVEGRVVAFK